MKHLLFFVFSLLAGTTALHAQVGIGTATPLARLHVVDSSVLFSASDDVPAIPGPAPVSGAGRRMMWYADKAAFRAGYVLGDQWDEASVGIYSFATGHMTTSGGFASSAMGTFATAGGDYSTAIGRSTTASGISSTAMGDHTTASGISSTAMGRNTNASGTHSTAIGFYTTASGSYSTAIGSSATASGQFSTAMGNHTTASGNNSTAMGGYTTASGAYSTAMGTYVSTNGKTGSFIIGDSSSVYNITSSTASNQMTMRFAGGYRLFANTDLTTGVAILPTSGNVGIGTFSPQARLHVVDSSVLFSASGIAITTPGPVPASGSGRRMMWYTDKAAFRTGYVNGAQWDQDNVGNYSTSMGFNTTASGISSTATGSYTTASGTASTAMGAYNIASGYRSTAMGSYASTDGNAGAFIIGDNSTFTATTSNATNQMTMRFAGGYRLFSNNALSAGVLLNASAGSWSNVSDRRKKENFHALNNEQVLLKVAALPITNWNYKAQDSSVRHIGPMAQDFYAAFQLDGTGADTTINTTDIDGVNMAAIQALEKRTADLRQQNALLTAQLAEMQRQGAVMASRLEALEQKAAAEPADNRQTASLQ